jgi:hypothetical protein
MDVDELRAALAKLSKTEREKLLTNLERVTFNFKINKSFLKYSSHPITVPREFYPFLEIQGITKKQEAKIILPNGSIAAAYIHYSIAGYGEYYQIRIRNFYSGIGIADLKIGDIVKIEIFKDGNKTRIELAQL